MGLVDKVTALLPWRRPREEAATLRPDVLALRDDLDRWFERFVGERWDAPASIEPAWTPAVDVHETDTDVVVTAEVPGLDRDDLDITVTTAGLTIRGEKREEREDRRKDYRVVECRYGAFVRSVPLPPALDVERAEARVKRGVLTVKIPKGAARGGARHIPIKT
jgi:HSP20 family protein